MKSELSFSPELEQEKISKVVLEFMRHGDKETNSQKTNQELLLTKKGRQQAIKKGRRLNPQAEVAIGWGSPRARTEETAMLVTLANENINPDATVEEIEATIDEEINKGGKKKKKFIEDPRLDYNFSGPGIGTWLTDLYKKSTPFMPIYIQESDQRALETNDTENDTYTRKAADIAEIVLRYAKVGNNFNSLVQETDKYEKNNNQLERYLGTHATVAESFLLKLLEKLNGVEARDELAKVLDHGFEETQGYRVEIVNAGKEQEIIVHFKTKEGSQQISTTVDLIEEIVKEGEEFEKKFKEK